MGAAFPMQPSREPATPATPSLPSTPRTARRPYRAHSPCDSHNNLEHPRLPQYCTRTSWHRSDRPSRAEQSTAESNRIPRALDPVWFANCSRSPIAARATRTPCGRRRDGFLWNLALSAVVFQSSLPCGSEHVGVTSAVSLNLFQSTLPRSRCQCPRLGFNPHSCAGVNGGSVKNYPSTATVSIDTPARE